MKFEWMYPLRRMSSWENSFKSATSQSIKQQEQLNSGSGTSLQNILEQLHIASEYSLAIAIVFVNNKLGLYSQNKVYTGI